MKYIYVLSGILVLTILVYQVLIDIDEKNYGFHGLFILPFILICLFILFTLFLIRVIKKFYKKFKNKKINFLFFTFYFLFFIFYFLFFVFYFGGIVRDIPSQLVYLSISIVYIFIYLIFYIKYFFRYIFVFITIISDIFFKYTLSNDLSTVFTTSNKQFYELNLYMIPLIFAIIQLIIEAYYFYQKEKPKWIRYERMRKYRRQKDYSEKL